MNKNLALIVIFILVFFSTGYAQDLQHAKKLYGERKWDEAFLEFSKIKKNTPGYAESMYHLGLISRRRKDYEKAEEYLKLAIGTNASVAHYHIALGSLYGQIASDANIVRQGLLAPKIKGAFETAAQLDPKNIESRWMLIAYYTRAPKIMGGDIEKSKTIADEIMKINQAEGNRAWGMIWDLEKKNDLAEKNFLRALALAPDSIIYYGALARFYETVSKPEKAFAVYARAVARFPENRQAYLQMGKIASTTGKNMDEGQKMLQAYLNLTTNKNDRNLANAHYYLGLIEKNRGNSVNAKKQIELALKINPDHKLSKELLRTL